MNYPFTTANRSGERLHFHGVVQSEAGPVLEVSNEVTPGHGPPMHVHYKQWEELTVKEGRIAYQVKGEAPGEAGPGETVRFNAGIPHKFWAVGDQVLRCDGRICPPDNVAWFIDMLYKSMDRNGGRPGLFDSAYLLHRYRGEFGMLEVPAFVQRTIFPVVRVVGTMLGMHRRFAGAPEPVR